MKNRLYITIDLKHVQCTFIYYTDLKKTLVETATLQDTKFKTDNIIVVFIPD